MVERLGIGAQATVDERGVSKSHGHEDVDRGAAIDQQARHLGHIANEILGRCGLVIDVASLGIGAMIQQITRDING